MFKMRIINLVNISTVLLLINLLQTKSQVNVEQLVTVLKVSVATSALFSETTNKKIEWNENFDTPGSQDYNQLRNQFCKLFLEYVKSVIPYGSDDGQCDDVSFEFISNTPVNNVQIILLLQFNYVGEKQIDTEKLGDHLMNKIQSPESGPLLQKVDPDFTVEVETQLIPISELQTTPSPTTAKNDAGKKDADDNGGEDSTPHIDTSVMTASGNKGKEDDDDNGGEDSTAFTAASAIAASANEGEHTDKAAGNSNNPKLLTSKVDDRIGIITLVVLIIVVNAVIIIVVVKHH